MSGKNYSKFYCAAPQKRFSLWLPEVLYDRISTESEVYGVPKSHIVKEALLFYYRSVDAKYNHKTNSTV